MLWFSCYVYQHKMRLAPKEERQSHILSEIQKSVVAEHDDTMYIKVIDIYVHQSNGVHLVQMKEYTMPSMCLSTECH